MRLKKGEPGIRIDGLNGLQALQKRSFRPPSFSSSKTADNGEDFLIRHLDNFLITSLSRSNHSFMGRPVDSRSHILSTKMKDLHLHQQAVALTANGDFVSNPSHASNGDKLSIQPDQCSSADSSGCENLYYFAVDAYEIPAESSSARRESVCLPRVHSPAESPSAETVRLSRIYIARLCNDSAEASKGYQLGKDLDD